MIFPLDSYQFVRCLAYFLLIQCVLQCTHAYPCICVSVYVCGILILKLEAAIPQILHYSTYLFKPTVAGHWFPLLRGNSVQRPVPVTTKTSLSSLFNEYCQVRRLRLLHLIYSTPLTVFQVEYNWVQTLALAAATSTGRSVL